MANLTIQQFVSKMTRHIRGSAKFTPELMEHLKCGAATNFVHYPESLAVVLEKPLHHKGRQPPRRYRYRPLAMTAEPTERRWTVKELLDYLIKTNKGFSNERKTPVVKKVY